MRHDIFKLMMGVGIRIKKNETITTVYNIDNITEKEEKIKSKIDQFDNKYGRKYHSICEIVSNPRNYIYDSDIAVFMVGGIDNAATETINKEKVVFITMNDKKTKWCSAFQNTLSKEPGFETELIIRNDDNSQIRLDRYSYTKLLEIYNNLESKIAEEEKRERALYQKNARRQFADYELEEYDALIISATDSREENRIMADIYFGKSFSITLYHGIKKIADKLQINIDIEILEKIIKPLSKLKCFKLRNIIADQILEIIFVELEKVVDKHNYSDKMEKDKVVKETITKEMYQVQEVFPLIRRFYRYVVTNEWSVFGKDELNIRANSIGLIMPCDNEYYPVEGFDKVTLKAYKDEIEYDLKILHNVLDYSLCDNGLNMFNEIIKMRLPKDKRREVDQINAEAEYEKLRKGEKNMKITPNRKNIASNKSVLFDYIHWQVIKESGIRFWK